VVLLITVLGAMPTEWNGTSLAGSPFPWLMFLQETLLFAAALLPAWLLARLEHRPATDYGLPTREFFGRRFWQGCVLGLAEVSLLVGSIGLFGGYRFGSLALSGPRTICTWLIFWSAFFIVVGLYEEFLFRGYLQFTLAGAIGFWPAAWILSLGFGALHLMNSGENWVGVAGVAAAGLVFALLLERTGNLWCAVGWHAAFDFGETFLYSVPNSGAVLRGHLSNATLEGPVWLTGGSVGPEGSVFSFLLMGLSALLIHVIFPQRKYLAGLPAVPIQRTSSETSTS
jgi:membrane protease YdiL (CAAX protease family)